LRRRVFAARAAADFRAAPPFVRAPRRADALRDDGVRLRAALRACCESSVLDTDDRRSRFNALRVARAREVDVRFCRRRPWLSARFAAVRVRSEACPFSGGGRSTPARLAFDSPIAMACLAERAPCFPSRTCSISSRTNSPACVDGALPARASRRARLSVVCSGM